MSDLQTRISQLVDAVVEGMGVDADIAVSVVDDELHVTISGEDLEALVGRDGQVIDALQYLLNQASMRGTGEERPPRVVLDVDGYRERRRVQLERLAMHAADEAVKYGEEIELDPMTPHDRRIVHLAIADRDDIVTRSEGNEPRRRIVVEPVTADD